MLNDGGVQRLLIAILIAWILFLPVTAIMGAAIYVALSYITSSLMNHSLKR